MVHDTPPYGPDKLHWEEAEAEEEIIRLKQYVSLCSKGRHKQGQRKAWRIHSPKNLTRWPWPLTLKINRVPDSLKD
jgi:hypothetical protein